MPRTRNPNKTTKARVNNSIKVEGSYDMPDNMRKPDCVYIRGEVIKQSHGTYIVAAENEMEVICTARKLENKRLAVIEGDQIVVEIPLLAMEPDQPRQKGRIVWRIRK